MMGGGTGPAVGTNATTCTPGPWHIQKMLQAADGFPMNLGFFGKGNASSPAGLIEQIEGGACGFKLHEDWGTTPSAIDCCLSVADDMDVQVLIHTDTLNESGFVENTIAAFKGRTIHSFHTEGAGGGHSPDIIKVCGEPNVIPASTTPTRPFTINTLDEALDMLMVTHHPVSYTHLDVYKRQHKMFLEKYVFPRREIQGAIIREAVASGELKRTTDPELLIDALNGPLFFRWLQGHAPLNENFAEAIFDKVIPGFQPQ